MSGFLRSGFGLLSIVALLLSVVALVGSLVLPRMLGAGQPSSSPAAEPVASGSPSSSPSVTPSEPASTPSPSAPVEAAPPPAPPTAAEGALQALATIPVTDASAWVPDYRRAEFGDAWIDVDGNGCSQRQDVLMRDLDQIVMFADGSCRVQTGVLDDPYTGVLVPFQHGEQTSQAVQIDHLVPLALAWRSGAWAWSPEQRVQFANDTSLLLAVEGGINQSRSDSDLAEWLPPEADARCGFVITIVEGVARYGLSMTAASHATAEAVLTGCGDEPGIVPAD
ncbi:HNH endonuclease family protein [Agrococcus sp. SGAir0287]|uniref:HNH endonuclease family protein n=1 Tax=Agrococcus sp. SGAir0287 TaxID=2070347 RepID=UPI0010F5A94F|nr:HNH endonuclease family protein [Agrococcus sp. SGAir0287]